MTDSNQRRFKPGSAKWAESMEWIRRQAKFASKDYGMRFSVSSSTTHNRITALLNAGEIVREGFIYRLNPEGPKPVPSAESKPSKTSRRKPAKRAPQRPTPQYAAEFVEDWLNIWELCMDVADLAEHRGSTVKEVEAIASELRSLGVELPPIPRAPNVDELNAMIKERMAEAGGAP